MIHIGEGAAPPVNPQRRIDFLRRLEGQTAHYRRCKVLRCAASKATLLLTKTKKELWQAPIEISTKALESPREAVTAFGSIPPKSAPIFCLRRGKTFFVKHVK